MFLKKKTPLLGHVLLVIFLSSSCASCKDFSWEPRPFVGDSKNSQLVNKDNVTVKCDQPAFDTYTCFDEANIAELVTAIDEANGLTSKQKKRLKSLIKKSSLPENFRLNR